MKGVTLYGSSGHGLVIADIVRSQGGEVVAFFDDNPKGECFAGVPYVSSVDMIVTPVIISIGSNRVRKLIAEREKSLVYVAAIHSSAIISPSVVVGEGSVVMQGAIVQAEASVGSHVIINTGATIDHECVIGDYVHISPNATLCGCVSVGMGAHIGAGAVVIQGVSIGEWATVGAGAVVIRDVPAGATVVGNPAKVLRGC
ncbi:MAG: acetyltransferase [Bacteroidales bacterium]